MERFQSFGQLLLRLIIGSSFAFAGIVKIGTENLKPPTFSMTANLPIALFGIALPWIELICGMVVLIGMPLTDPRLRKLAKILIGTIFVAAAIDKIANPDAFAKSINNFHLLPYEALNVPALILPWVELITGAMLLFSIKEKAASFLISSMLIIFIVAILTAIARGYNIDCGCFGESSPAAAAEVTKVGWAKVLEDARWLIASLFIFLTSKDPLSVEE
ncbi:MAG: MauE/DoxX family redox-associated membrane protein [bacterium]